MSKSRESLAQLAVSPRSVRADGHLTIPRTYGVYELPPSAKSTRRFRFGNHSIRQHELEREFGSCKLVFLFHQRPDAANMAASLTGREP